MLLLSRPSCDSQDHDGCRARHIVPASHDKVAGSTLVKLASQRSSRQTPVTARLLVSAFASSVAPMSPMLLPLRATLKHSRKDAHVEDAQGHRTPGQPEQTWFSVRLLPSPFASSVTPASPRLFLSRASCITQQWQWPYDEAGEMAVPPCETTRGHQAGCGYPRLSSQAQPHPRCRCCCC